MNSLTITIAPPPTSTNSGQNRRGIRDKRLRQDRAAKAHGTAAATKALEGRARPRWPGTIEATIIWTSKTRSWPDVWNMPGMLKYEVDGVADRLGFNDRQITRINFVFATNREDPHVDIVLEEIE